MADEPSLHVVQLTAPGRGAVSTLLVEGPGAVRAVGACFRAQSGRPLERTPVDRVVFGRFGDEPAEEVVVRRRADGSVEVHCHGGLAAVEMVCRLLAGQGCRELGWKDWVRRQHHDDPIAAEARLALADARTERTAAILLDQLGGALGREIEAIRALLSGGKVDAARGRLATLLGRAELGRHLVRPWRAVLAGRPNVGKSSLINALLGYGRSIVHHVPGTTRDVLTATTAMDGWPVELADTAGLHEAGEAIEREGVARARQQLAAADLVVLVFDRSQPWSEEDTGLLAAWPSALVVHSKCDLPQAAGPRRPEGLRTSAMTGEGIGRLVLAMAGRLVPQPPPAGAAVPVTETQVQRLLAAREALDRGDADAAGKALEEPPGSP
jgi:tRNA modification GTPase